MEKLDDTALDIFAAELASFKSSNDEFRLLDGPAAPPHSPAQPAPTRLVVLDSSFNPPTVAHGSMLLEALSTLSAADKQTIHALLLLSLSNADKAPQPASFQHRLCMMRLFALETQALATKHASLVPVIHIGVTTRPFFADKSRAIAESTCCFRAAEQLFLVGYDTFERIVNPKYYHTTEPGRRPVEAALAPFFERAKLRVSLRGGRWGGVEEQRRRMLDDGDGETGAVLARCGWRERIAVAGVVDGADGVSSSAVRSGIGDLKPEVSSMLGEGVRGWVERYGLYQAE